MSVKKRMYIFFKRYSTNIYVDRGRNFTDYIEMQHVENLDYDVDTYITIHIYIEVYCMFLYVSVCVSV